MDELLFRQMPYSAEAEMSVLGAIIIDKERLTEIIGIIRLEDFYINDNREIYGAMLELFNAGKDIDLISIIEQLKIKGTFEKIGGRGYIMQLVEMVPSAANIEIYARIVEEKANLRRLINAAGEIEKMCIDGADEAKTIMDLAEQKIFSILDGRRYTGFVTIKEVILSEYDRLHKLAGDKTDMLGIPTGFRDIDRILVGLNRSDLYLIAARPGMGKTSFALNIAQNVAVHAKKPVAVFSLEMSKEQLVSRMLSSEAMVDSYKLRIGELSDDDWTKLACAAGVLSSSSILIDDTSGINVLEMKAKCRRVKDLGLIIIDYLQLMQSPKKTENRVQEVSEISRSLKIMAKELNVPIICLSQLSRSPESRQDKRPMLSDLRESGAIEQDADVVMFLYREEVYNPDTDKRNVAECIISKNRHGSTDKVYLQWLPQYTRFSTQERIRND